MHLLDEVFYSLWAGLALRWMFVFFKYVLHFKKVFFLSKRFAHSISAKWANCSGRSGEMSNREWCAQVAQKEWVIVSKSLRSLTKNERIAHFLRELLIRSLFWQKTSNSLRNSMSEFPNLIWTNTREFQIMIWENLSNIEFEDHIPRNDEERKNNRSFDTVSF